MKLGAQTNLNVLNLITIFICPLLDQKYQFWLNLAERIKIV